MSGLSRLRRCDRHTASARLFGAGMVLAELATRPLGHRGYHQVARALGSPWLVGQADATLRLERGGELTVRLADPYWSKLVATGYRYEPELTRLLQHVGCDELDLVDAGANIGFWAVTAAGLFPRGRVVAVEPNPPMVAQLRVNVAPLGSRVEVVEVALTAFEQPKVRLTMSQLPGGHAGASAAVRESRLGTVSVDVPAKTLDQLVGEAGLGGRPLLVKLDVEGLEDSILGTAKVVDNRLVAFVYEDHGHDRECRATRALLERNQHDLYLLTEGRGAVLVRRVDELLALKTREVVGYNCLAVPRTGPWADELLLPGWRADGF